MDPRFLSHLAAESDELRTSGLFKDEHLDQAIGAFTKVGRERDVIG